MVSTEAGTAAPQGRLRALNDRSFGRLLSSRGAMTRRALADASGLSRPAAQKIIARLVEDHVVVQAGEHASLRRGRNAELFALHPKLGVAAGVEVLADRLRVRTRSLDGTVAAEREAPFDPDADIPGQFRAALAPELDDGYQHRAVCVALPGVLDIRTGDILQAYDLPNWRPGTAAAIQQRLGCPTEFDNDVNLQAEGERAAGVAADLDDFLLVRYSHGIGAAIVLDGRPRRGAHGAAGELGFFPVGRGALRYQSVAGAQQLAELCGEHHDPDFAWLRRVAERGEPAVWDRLAHELAPVITSTVTVLDPGAIVLSGEVSLLAGEPLRAAIERAIVERLHWHLPTVLLSTAGMGATLIGASLRALRQLEDSAFPAELAAGVD